MANEEKRARGDWRRVFRYGDFGYTGQKYFRGRWPIYRCVKSSYVAFPFGMEKMVEKEIISPEQLIKFMNMLEGDDRELEEFAKITLTQLRDNYKIESLV